MGGESSGGPASGGSIGGRAGAANGGSSGGTGPSTGGTAPSTAGTGGKGGTGGGPTVWSFSGKGACDAGQPSSFCDDFDGTAFASRPAGHPWSTPTISDARSRTHGMRTGFNTAPMGYTSGVNDFKCQLLGALSDQDRSSLPQLVGQRLGADIRLGGRELSLSGQREPAGRRARARQIHARRRRQQWTCVEIDKVASNFQATVTVFGDAPFQLAPLGGAPDAGVDQSLLDSIPGKMINIDHWTWSLGDSGTDIEIDDVRVVGAGQASVCKDFIDANK